VLNSDITKTGNDRIPLDLEGIVRMPRVYTNYSFINSILPSVAPGTTGRLIRIPANSLSDLNAMWQVLASQCYALSIQWTDGVHGDVNGNLYWYGVEGVVTNDNDTPNDPDDDTVRYDAYGNPNSNPSVPGPGIPSKTSWKGAFAVDPSQIEFNAGMAGEIYRALWTKDNQSNWPVAIRIRFRISNPAVIGEGEAAREYEIVCPVGQ